MMLEKIYDKYNFDEDYEVYKYGQQVLIFNSENDFYDYDRCKIESDLIVKKKNIYKDGIYYMKFLLKGTEDDVRENL